MKISEFEKELQAIDSNLAIRPCTAPQRVKDAYPEIVNISSITYMGTEICSIPSEDIYDELNGTYGVDIRGDGRFMPHRTRPTALKMVQETLEKLKDKDFADSFFGRGEYSDAALKASDEKQGDVTVEEEITIEATEVQGGMLEEPK